jgi:hypothetical protein
MNLRRSILAVGLGGPLLLAAALARAGETPAPAKPAEPPAEVLGSWEHEVKPKGFVLLEKERCTIVSGGRTLVGRVLAWRSGGVKLRVYGTKKSYDLEVADGMLAMTEVAGGERGETRRLRKLEAVPPELVVKPMEFGKAEPVAPDRVKAVGEELRKRQAEDQAVRKDAARRGEMAKVDADNTAWLRKLVGELGWIDAGRFGAGAANDAFLLVQHSGDLPLMTAALPAIERDVRARKLDGQPFALLFDRTQLMLGERQRYGTQVGQNAGGEPVVLPLEDRARVEEFRREIGIFPLSKYLEMMKQMTGGKEIKFAEEE